MNEETKKTLRNFAICVGVELLIGFIVIWIKGFFTDSTAVNIQILADAFFVAGILMVLFGGLMFVAGEGALIGVGFVLRNVVLAFVPMGRAKMEKYADYRERKLGEMKARSKSCVFITGLIFLVVGIVLTAVWYKWYYFPSVKLI